MGVGVGSGQRRPSLGGMVLRNSETRWYSCVDVNVTKNEAKWQEGGSEPNVKVFMSGQEVRRWHQQEGTRMVQPDEKSWPLSILYYCQYQVNSKISILCNQLSDHQLISLHWDLKIADPPLFITCLLPSLPSLPTWDSKAHFLWIHSQLH